MRGDTLDPYTPNSVSMTTPRLTHGGRALKRLYQMAVSGLVAGVLLTTATIAQAQLSGHNLKGDVGLVAGSQPPPGRYVGGILLTYRTTGFNLGGRDFDGADLTAGAFSPFVWVVTDTKVLGANYGFVVAPAFTNTKFEVPRFGIDDRQFGFSDLYIVPVQLGWHFEGVDVIASYGFFAPTGRYESGADDNIGLGMWSHEFSLGATVFLGDGSWHVATAGFYEVHSSKQDIDAKVGDLLTLEGGLGKTMANGLSLGVAYYAQWKMTSDSGAELSRLVGALGKHRAFAVGPQFSLLQGGLVLRGLFEVGVRNQFEGFLVLASLSAPF